MSFLAYYHTSMRWALNNLSAPEFKIYTYLISIAIRPRKSEVKQYKNGIEVYNLYRKGHLLPVNVSLGRISKECRLGIRTVSYAIKKFVDMGIIINITHNKGRINNVYLVGIENMWSAGEDFKPDYYFTEFTFIQEGNKMPAQVREFILSNRYNSEALALGKIPVLNKRLEELFAQDKRQIKQDNVVNLSEVRGGHSF